MRVALSRCVGLVLLLGAVLLLSLQFGVEAGGRESSLSPANPLFEVEQFGLKFLWRAELGRIGGDRLEKLYPLGRHLVAETPGGELHLLEAETGRWETMTKLRYGLACGPALFGKTMLFISGSRLYGFDTETGELGPSYATGFGQFAAPLVFEDSIILAGADGDIVRLTVEGREEVWRTAIRGTIWEKPLLAAGHLYAAGQQLVCLAPDSGLELWRWTPAAPSGLSTGVVAHGGTVFVGDDRGILYGLEGEYGEPKWRTHLGAPLSALRLAGDRLLAFTSAPALTCFTASGQRRLLWHYPSAQRLLTTVGEVAYVECEDGSVAALSLPEGEELWREPLPRDCVVAGDPARPVLYIGNQTGTIAAFEKLD